MRVSTFSIHPHALATGSSVALAVGLLTVLGTCANAGELDPITVSPPIVTTVEHEAVTEIPIKRVTVNAQIAADAETLRNESGVVLLHDRVLEAARKACFAADPLSFDSDNCVQHAVKAAQPQIAAAIADARSRPLTG